jgi:hypothetical protein
MGIIEHITKIGHLPIRNASGSSGRTIAKEVIYIQGISYSKHFLTRDVNKNHTGQEKALTLDALSFTFDDTILNREKSIYFL